MRNRKAWLLTVILPVLALLIAACGSSAKYQNTTSNTNNTPNALLPMNPPTAAVIMVNTSFQPQQIEVPVGTTVIWTNQDSVAHTVTSGTRDNPTSLFDSGEIGAGATFSFTFTAPGTYPYHCTPHVGMDGTIVVTAASG